MSKHQVEEEDINIGEAYSKAERFLEEKKQPIAIVLGAILVVVFGTFYYYNMYLPPLQKEAAVESFGAQQAFENDSFLLAMNGNESFLGFEDIADQYGSTSIGNTAKYYMGVSLLNTGSYEDAIDFFKSYTPTDHMTRALKEGGIGDALSQLGEYEDAVTAYEKASNAYVNEYTTPIYLKKAGILSEKMGDYEKAVKFYERIASQYPDSEEGRDIEKYLAHANSFVK